MEATQAQDIKAYRDSGTCHSDTQFANLHASFFRPGRGMQAEAEETKTDTAEEK